MKQKQGQFIVTKLIWTPTGWNDKWVCPICSLDKRKDCYKISRIGMSATDVHAYEYVCSEICANMFILQNMI